eukprot:4747163-Prymnesium_polylepis.2
MASDALVKREAARHGIKAGALHSHLSERCGGGSKHTPCGTFESRGANALSPSPSPSLSTPRFSLGSLSVTSPPPRVTIPSRSRANEHSTARRLHGARSRQTPADASHSSQPSRSSCAPESTRIAVHARSRPRLLETTAQLRRVHEPECTVTALSLKWARLRPTMRPCAVRRVPCAASRWSVPVSCTPASASTCKPSGMWTSPLSTAFASRRSREPGGARRSASAADSSSSRPSVSWRGTVSHAVAHNCSVGAEPRCSTRRHWPQTDDERCNARLQPSGVKMRTSKSGQDSTCSAAVGARSGGEGSVAACSAPARGGQRRHSTSTAVEGVSIADRASMYRGGAFGVDGGSSTMREFGLTTSASQADLMSFSHVRLVAVRRCMCCCRYECNSSRVWLPWRCSRHSITISVLVTAAFEYVG